jgi:hypothetical protein
MSLEVAALRSHANAFPLDRLEVVAPGDQVHVGAAARQRGAHVRSDRASAENGKPHAGA